MREPIKVLLVDDEKIVREGMKTVINWQKNGCEPLHVAATAEEALAEIERFSPDLVITDVYMRQTTGLELAKAIKSKYSDIIIVILSGYESFDYARTAIEVGVMKYLIKPLFPEELENVISEVRKEIENHIQQKNAVNTAGDVDKEEETSYQAMHEKWARQATEIILKRYGEKYFTIEDVANDLNISHGYLSRIFRKYMQKSVIAYLTEVRISEAKKLLRSGDMKQEVIAEKIGYCNAYYFNSQFKKTTGVTPGEFRRRIKKNNV
jgi:two-component system response regulator YesN